MKKIALALIMGLLIQVVPMTVMASDGPPPPPPVGGQIAAGALLGAAIGAYFVFFEGGSKASAAKKTGNEFVDLNNNTSFKTLLGQVAGGSKDTLEILK